MAVRLTRMELMLEAHRKLGVLQTPYLPPEWKDRTVLLLDAIMREESDRFGGQNSPAHLVEVTSFPLVQDRTYFDVGSDVPGSTGSDLQSAYYHDSKGNSTELKLVNGKKWASVADKGRLGEPELVFFEKEWTTSGNKLRVYPRIKTVVEPSYVNVSGAGYICISSHTASSENKARTGLSYYDHWLGMLSYYPKYQEVKANSGGVYDWVEGAEYKSGDMVTCTIRRDLTQWTNDSDYIVAQGGMERYLTYRLAFDLSSHFGISIEERQWLKQEYIEARELVFPGMVGSVTDYQNKVTYF